MPSTRPFIPRILLAFDFDGTLASDSINAVLELYGLGRPEWDRDFVERLGEGWDAIMRRGQALIDVAEAHDRPLTRALMREAAERVLLFDGVVDMPGHLRELARGVHQEIEVEFIVLSAASTRSSRRPRSGGSSTAASRRPSTSTATVGRFA